MPRQSGLSLVEIVLVVSILAVIAAIAIPGLSGSDPYRLELAAEELAQAMRFARSEAIRNGGLRGFRLAPAEKRVQLFSLPASPPPTNPIYDVYHPLSGQVYDIDLDTQVFVSVDSVSRSITFQGGCTNPDLIYFDENGTPWCGDPVTVALQQQDLTLSLGPLSRHVILHGITGRVTVP